MTTLARRRRRHTLLALLAGVSVALAAPMLVYVGAKAITNSRAGQNALDDASPEQSFPQTPTAMLATVSAANELMSVTVLVLAPDADPSPAGYDQRGGSVVSVPISADAGSGDQPRSLHDAYALGGEAELLSDVQSVIGANIDFSRVMKREELAGFLLGLAPMQVGLPGDVLGADDAVLYPAGTTELSTAQVCEIMTTRSATQRDRLRRPIIEALWAGISASVGTGREGQALSPALPASFDEMATRLMAGPVASRGLVARPIDATRNPDGLDIESIDRPDTVLVFASIAPGAMSRPDVGLSYRLEAPPGYDQQVRKTIGILQFLHGNVVSVDLNATPRVDTIITVYDPSLAESESTDNDIFGAITVQNADVRLSGIDRTVSLGTEYLEGVDLAAPDPTSTSVEPTETSG